MIKKVKKKISQVKAVKKTAKKIVKKTVKKTVKKKVIASSSLVKKNAKKVKKKVLKKKIIKKTVTKKKKVVKKTKKLPHTKKIIKKVAKKNVKKITLSAKKTILKKSLSLIEEFKLEELIKSTRELSFFDKQSEDCLSKACENSSMIQGYCRLHYIQNWKQLQEKQNLLKTGKLQDHIENLLKNYPLTTIEKIFENCIDQKTFIKVLKKLKITILE